METKAQVLTRRDRNKLKNRTEILEAALAVFAEKGYQQASIQEIADRADFAVSTIYALFENKEDLYRRASVDVGRRCGDIFDAAMASGVDEYEQLVNFARAKGAAMRLSPEGTQMLENEQRDTHAGSAPFPKEGIGRIYERFLRRIRDLFASGIAKGIFMDKDPALLAMALDSMTTALVKSSLVRPDEHPYEEQVEDMIDIFFRPVLAKRPTAHAKNEE